MSKVSIENNTLVIRLPIQTPTPSKTWKTMLVASHNAGYDPNVTVAGKAVRITCNAFIKAE